MPENLVQWAILFVATVQCLASLVLLVLLLLLLKAFLYVKAKAPPIVDTVSTTLHTVQGVAANVRDTTTTVKASTDRVKTTTAFVAEQAVAPAIITAGTLAGFSRTVSVLYRSLFRRRR